MPDWLAAAILGLIEGVTEFLPVSSTGHLLLVENLGWVPRQSDLFNILIQCAAVFAVFGVFSERIQQLLFGLRDAANRDYLLKLGVAFVLTGLGGLWMKKAGLELPDEAMPIAWATLIGGVAFLLAEEWLLDRPASDTITWRVALAVAVGQLVAAAFPGASRSGTTILFALLLGASRPVATEFSFLVGIPTLAAAGALELLKTLKTGGLRAIGDEKTLLLVGGSVAALTAFLTVKWLLKFVQTHTFIAFGWYRIALGVATLAWASSAAK
ncbi:MAG: undecaprenyl-diphosphate phosphatase [Verrucomicrobia bacterium]|nr:undecaprenyl-diphosphate phosphatase [Verrucomicrobiota bacterium]